MAGVATLQHRLAGRGLVLVVVIAGLALTGALLGRLVDPAWQAMRAREPALQLDSSLAAGRGVTLALLGGFRGLAADAVWLRMYALWETHDLPGTETLVRLVTGLDPRPVYFWLNGARILAYDLTAWRIAAAGGYEALAEPARDRISREQAALALRHLDVAMKFHPVNPDLWIERANIELTRMNDVAAAAESYRRASELPGAPFYTARLHAEMLRRLGRKAEALAWLIQVHPRQPARETEDGDVVLERIRQLERELRVPAERAYRPQ